MRSLRIVVASENETYRAWVRDALARTTHVVVEGPASRAEPDLAIVDPRLSAAGLAAHPARVVALVGAIVCTPWELEVAFELAETAGMTVLPCATTGDLAWQLESLVQLSAPGPEAPVSHALAALRAEYGADLPRRLDVVRAFVAPPGAWAEVVGEAHRLAGTAGAFGFPRIGAAARLLERAADLAIAAAGDVANALEQLRAAEAAELTPAIDLDVLARALIAESLAR